MPLKGNHSLSTSHWGDCREAPGWKWGGGEWIRCLDLGRRRRQQLGGWECGQEREQHCL